VDAAGKDGLSWTLAGDPQGDAQKTATLMGQGFWQNVYGEFVRTEGNFPTGYSQHCPNEAFAEFHALFYLEPDFMRAKYPHVYQFFEQQAELLSRISHF
jgi:hypothetical protein